mgnify:CR=1 FL=1
MSGARKSKQALWEIMRVLEEAGEEDVCALLNTVMGENYSYGTGGDLQEFWSALIALESKGELRTREYQLVDGRTQFGSEVKVRSVGLAKNMHFEAGEMEGSWRWRGELRLMVEVL